MSRAAIASLSIGSWGTPAVVAERLPVKVYTSADGLARNQVYHIFEDSKGFIWLCTGEGISRFDGYEFTNYGTDEGLPDRAVSEMIETSDGVYWAATRNGLCRLDWSMTSARAARRITVFVPQGGKGAKAVGVIEEDPSGAIWCGTDNGLHLFRPSSSGGRFEEIDIGIPADIVGYRTVTALFLDGGGSLWAGSHQGLFCRRRDGRVNRFTPADGLASNVIVSLEMAGDGDLWVGTDHGLCVLRVEPGGDRATVSRVYTKRDGLPSESIPALLRSADGTIWAGGYGGLVRFSAPDDHGTRSLRCYGAEHGVGQGGIFAVARDHDGNLWLGTEYDGAIKIARRGFITYDRRDGLASSGIGSLFETRAGVLCAIVRAGDLIINRFDGRHFHAIRPRLPVGITNLGWGSYQSVLQDHTGEWWIPTGQGLCRYPSTDSPDDLARLAPSAVYTTRDGLGGDEIFRLYEDSHGDLWIGTITAGRRTLTRWERTTGEFQQFSDGLPAAAPTAFCEDRGGNLWIGFYQSGVARYREGSFQLYHDVNGAPISFVTCLYIDSKGRLWIGTTRNGLLFIGDPAAATPRIEQMTTRDRLSSSEVRCVVEDRWGRIYAGTARGVDRVDPETRRVWHFTTADGLANSETSVALRARDGTLWFGTLGGLCHYEPEPERSPQPPRVLIQSVRIGGLPSPISELGEEAIAGLTLDSGTNAIQIGFVGMSYTPGERLRYSYRLDGADQDWNAPTQLRTVNYARLAPGRYRFAVRAVNVEDAVSPVAATVAFAVLPPIWLRWWFLTLAGSAVALTAYAIHRARVEHLVEVERVRTRLATDLHDDIGSSLSRISILSEVARERAGNAEPGVTDSLSRIAESARELIDSMGDIVWATNPSKDNLGDLVHRMRRFANDICSGRRIAFRLRAPEAPPDGAPDLRLDPDLRRDVYLVFKEALNNIVKHSGCGSAHAEIRIEHGWMALDITDDGHGFDPSAEKEGQGVRSMQMRADRLAGSFEIRSESGKGSRILVRVPLSSRRRSARHQHATTSAGGDGEKRTG